MLCTHGHNEVDAALVRSKFGPPMFEPEAYRKQMYCIEESICGIVGLFCGLRTHSAPWELCPFALLLMPCVCCNHTSS